MSSIISEAERTELPASIDPVSNMPVDPGDLQFNQLVKNVNLNLQPSTTKVHFTRYRSSNLLSKTYQVDDGKIIKTPAARMAEGYAERIAMNFAEFPKALADADCYEAFGYGLHDTTIYPNKVRIVVAGKGNHANNVLSRTKECFAYREAPGVLFLDHDPNPHGKECPYDALLNILGSIIPHFEQAAWIMRGSLSSGVRRVDQSEATAPALGYHLYIPVQDASDIPRFGKVLFARLWLAGEGFIALSANGSMLVRSVIDSTVFSPERLDFVGKPVIASPLLTYSQPLTKAKLEGGALDTRLLRDLTPDEEAQYAALVERSKAAKRADGAALAQRWSDAKCVAMVAAGADPNDAKAAIDRMLNTAGDELPGMFPLYFTKGHGNSVTVNDVLANPKAFDQESLADPVEGRDYGTTTAKFYWNDGNPTINSFAHGGCLYTLPAVGENDDSAKRTIGKKDQTTLLVDIGKEYSLFHSEKKDAYAIIGSGIPAPTMALRSQEFKERLSYDFFKRTGKGCSGVALTNAIDTLEAIAKYERPQHEVFMRVANRGNAVYIDLGCPDWKVIEITPDGWEVLEQSPVKFVRKRGSEALPMPCSSEGDIALLRRYANVTEEQMPLVIGWLLCALAGVKPYPVLVLQGEQGTGKSMTSRVLRSLVDPSNVPLRSRPKETRDLLVSAGNNHVVVLDNLSGLTPEMSDCLCQLSTGGGFDMRALYTDTEQTLIDIQRPVLINGIDDFTRPDLLERSFIITLPVIEENNKMDEFTMNAAFAVDRPRILGGLLTAMAHGLKYRDGMVLESKTRMADAALWITACERGMGSEGAFMAAHKKDQLEAVEMALENNPVGSAILALMHKSPEWRGTPTMLAADLQVVSEHGLTRFSDWPRSLKGLSNMLKRLQPGLRKLGIHIEVTRTAKERLYIIKAMQA